VTRRSLWAVLILVLVAAAAAMTVALPALPSSGDQTPTARIAKGPLKLTVHAVGELRAGRTMTLITPSVGGMLRIVRLVTTGSPVKTGDAIVEFDPADQQYQLEQAVTELAEAEQVLVKMKADGAVQAAQDQVALLNARFAVRSAELDSLGNEFTSPVQAEKNTLSLEEARRRLAQLEEDVKSRAVTSRASLAVAEERRDRARMSKQRAEQTIESLVLKSPLDGVVMIKENRDASGGFFFTGMVLPEYREGDSVWGGRPVADVIESGRMEVRAKVNENDRANLSEGEVADVFVDALPGRTFKARVGAVSGLAKGGAFFETASTTRQFDVVFAFESPDPAFKAGSSVRVVIPGREIPDALQVPRQAVFERAGKNFVFARVNGRFERRDVKVEHRTENRLAISGLDEGTEVALIDPTAVTTSAPASTAPAMPSGGSR
jgi:multidrug efflux pump subunit AcrA (membrane-fusion protein)